MEITETRALDPGARHELEALVLVAQASDGYRPLSDDAWGRLAGAAGPGDRVLVERIDAHLVAAALVHRVDEHWQLETVVHPRHRGSGLRRALLEGALDALRAEGGTVVLWLHDAEPSDERAASELGFRLQRRLLQMRRSLPAPAPTWPEGIRVRPFRPGIDDDEWLAVNNAAFAGHPEQGHWTAAGLAARLRADWFDPDGFLIAEDDAGIAGFCWTKVHADVPEGEIYVIAVDPAHQGRGLGRALVLGGLGWLARRGLPRAMLFVDTAETAAVSLYRALGFDTVRTDLALERRVDSTAGTGSR